MVFTDALSTFSTHVRGSLCDPGELRPGLDSLDSSFLRGVSSSESSSSSSDSLICGTSHELTSLYNTVLEIFKRNQSRLCRVSAEIFRLECQELPCQFHDAVSSFSWVSPRLPFARRSESGLGHLFLKYLPLQKKYFV